MTEIVTCTALSSPESLSRIYQYEFKRIWKNNLLKNKKNMLWGIVFLALGSFLLFYRQPFGYFFIGSGLMYLVMFFNYVAQYGKAKRKAETVLKKEAEKLQYHSKYKSWKLTPTHFIFSDHKIELKVAWEEITYCLLDNVYLYITIESLMHVVISKENTDDEHFDQTIAYLQHHARFQQI
ncbi:hypothetical protein [Chryseobacterium camelliae]|uniref:hypothetical protein n=1 Tax=Chryseobacterium camelliae TaxID=1265445 RepID=UPI00285FAC94|nr:hypothetical protein [Chryseobacterium camelliae]MDR6516623.1 bacteriorhodopsin [Chryseobacterium camelliae]